MFTQLSQNHYHRVRPLFANLDKHLIIAAVLNGDSPAQIFVDNADNPKTAFMKSPEGDFLVGESSNSAFIAGMKNWISENLINGEEDEIVFESSLPEWEAPIKEILAERPPLAYERYYYEISAPTLKPPALPSAFQLQFVTNEFMAQSHIKNIEPICDAIKSNWISDALFFEKGFGACILHEDEVVSWSMADCVVGQACEIGIHTQAEFQKRGLATALVAALVDYLFQRGFERIGWHCWVDNWASIAVAEKVGFIQKERYLAYISLQSEMINHAFAGYKRLQVQDYQNALGFYEKAIQTVDDNSRYFLPRVHWEMARVQAGLAQHKAAFAAMREALALGIKYSENALNAIEFLPLQSNPEWNALFTKEKDSHS